MRYSRLYSDEDGESHFAEGDIELTEREFAPPARPFSVSDPAAATGVVFFEAPPGWRGEPHPAPARQWAIPLINGFTIEASDGEVRTISPGEMLLLEDTTGKGHTTWVGDEGGTGLFVQVPD